MTTFYNSWPAGDKLNSTAPYLRLKLFSIGFQSQKLHFLITFQIIRAMKTSTIFLIVTALTFSSFTLKEREQNHIKIINLNTKPIVSGYINGKKAYFLIDTGSDLTIFANEAANLYKFEIGSKGRSKLLGINSQSGVLKSAYKIDLKMGEDYFSTGFGACDMTSLVNSIHQKTGFKISGIIGSDLMKKYRFRIDYAEKKIYYEFYWPNKRPKMFKFVYIIGNYTSDRRNTAS